MDFKARTAYLWHWITWRHLRAIATTTLAQGGLGLFEDGPQACTHLFGKHFGPIFVTRPDTDLDVLKRLAGQEYLLRTLAENNGTWNTQL